MEQSKIIDMMEIMVLSASTGSTIFSKEHVFTPIDTAITPPIQMVDKQET